MFITRLKWKLDPDAIRATPRTQGVFGLWDGEELVYIGTTERGVFLPEALERPLKLKQQGLLSVSHFTWEITITPRSWSAELLRAYFNEHGVLPRYNRSASPLANGAEAHLNPA
jgi:hypothetical protein